MRTIESVRESNVGEIAESLIAMKQSEIRVIVVWAQSYDVKAIVETAAELQMGGSDGYTWIFSETIFEFVAELRSSVVSDAIINVLQGAIYIGATEGGGTAAYEGFAERYRARHAEAVAQWGADGCNLELDAYGTPVWKHPTQQACSSVKMMEWQGGFWSAYMVWAIARAYNRLIESTDETAPSWAEVLNKKGRLLQALAEMPSFAGASGEVSFRKNGDRNPAGVRIALSTFGGKCATSDPVESRVAGHITLSKEKEEADRFLISPDDVGVLLNGMTFAGSCGATAPPPHRVRKVGEYQRNLDGSRRCLDDIPPPLLRTGKEATPLVIQHKGWLSGDLLNAIASTILSDVMGYSVLISQDGYHIATPERFGVDGPIDFDFESWLDNADGDYESFPPDSKLGPNGIRGGNGWYATTHELGALANIEHSYEYWRNGGFQLLQRGGTTPVGSMEGTSLERCEKDRELWCTAECLSMTDLSDCFEVYLGSLNWTSAPNMFEQAHKLFPNVPFVFVFLGESMNRHPALVDRIARRVPTLFYNWSPTLTADVTDGVTRVDLPKCGGLSDIFDDSDSSNNCDFQTELLYKIASTRVKSSHPDARTFALNFRLSTVDSIEGPVELFELFNAHQFESKRGVLTSEEVVDRVSCEWVKNNRHTWEPWVVDTSKLSEIIVDYSNWASNQLVSAVFRHIVHKYHGDEHVVKLQPTDFPYDVYPRLKRGDVHVNVEVWPFAKPGFDADMMKTHPLGYTGRDGIYTTSALVDEIVQKQLGRRKAKSRKKVIVPQHYSSLLLSNVLRLYESSGTRKPRIAGKCLASTPWCVNGTFTPEVCAASGGECAAEVIHPNVGYKQGWWESLITNLNLNVSVRYFGGEDQVAEALRSLLDDVHTGRSSTLGGLFYLYYPSANFDKYAGQVQRLEFPEWNSECYQGHNGMSISELECDPPEERLQVVYSSSLADRAPRISHLLDSFAITTEELSSLLRAYDTAPAEATVTKVAAEWLDAGNLPEHESWIFRDDDSSCDWECLARMVGPYVGGVVGSVVAICAAVFFWKRHRYHVRLAQEHEALAEARLDAAIDSVSTLSFPESLLNAADFMRLGRFTQYEELRDQGLLLVLDGFDDSLHFMTKHKICFFSHQWTSWTSPDPSNAQYRAATAALAHVIRTKGWALDNTFCWVDFSSIPQRNKAIQNLAIRTLSLYASNSHAFVIVAPKVKHSDMPNVVCDVDSYASRAWCRAEIFCHSLRNGTKDVFLATEVGTFGKDDEVFLKRRKGLLTQGFRVFEGNLTCCQRRHEGMTSCDRESLVVPMLGLYGELLGVSNTPRRQRSKYRSREQDLAKINKSREQLDRTELRDLVTAAGGFKTIFPETFVYEANGTKPHRKPLFNDLVQRMKERAAVTMRHTSISALARDEGVHRLVSAYISPATVKKRRWVTPAPAPRVSALLEEQQAEAEACVEEEPLCGEDDGAVIRPPVPTTQ